MGDPDWRENVIEAVRANAIYKTEFTRDLIPFHMRCSHEFVGLLDSAARVLDYNRSTFARRAIAVQVAKVLGVPVSQVLHHSPAPGPFGTAIQSIRGGRDLGLGIEDFCPHPGCDGKHLL